MDAGSIPAASTILLRPDAVFGRSLLPSRSRREAVESTRADPPLAKLRLRIGRVTCVKIGRRAAPYRAGHY